MEQLKLAISLVIIHLCYYFYSQVWSDIIKRGMIHNNDNKIISALRTKYKVTIRTFQKNTNHFGFAWFKTIFLNENLFKKPKALLWTFYHEFYHLQHKHKRNLLLHRLLFSFLPLLIMIHWAAFIVIYIGAALLMEKIRKVYEKNANEYANKMYKLNEIPLK